MRQNISKAIIRSFWVFWFARVFHSGLDPHLGGLFLLILALDVGNPLAIQKIVRLAKIKS